MKANVGGFDRILRIVVGLALTVLAATGVVGAWGYLGLIVLATGVFRFCGAYTVLGINTCPMQKGQDDAQSPA
jgi:ABC-type branched-subunit amino acid transport system permease subunit